MLRPPYPPLAAYQQLSTALFNLLDTDKNGLIDAIEFVSAMACASGKLLHALSPGPKTETSMSTEAAPCSLIKEGNLLLFSDVACARTQAVTARRSWLGSSNASVGASEWDERGFFFFCCQQSKFRSLFSHSVENEINILLPDRLLPDRLLSFHLPIFFPPRSRVLVHSRETKTAPN